MKTGLLSGIRVADFTWALAGPFCAEVLALMGCEVIKIENRKRLDTLRRVSTALGFRDEGDVDRSVEFNMINLNKKSLGLDLGHPKGVEIAKRLIAISDVVVENFSPGVMEKLGLGYEELKKIKPDIIMLSISYSGHSGPEVKYLGYASLFHAVSGLAHLTGYPGGPPGYIRAPIDTMVGATAATALLAALFHRRRTGEGQYIDLSAREAISCLIGHYFIAAARGREFSRQGNDDESLAPHGCYPCRGEGEWISIAVESEEEWHSLCRVLGAPSLAADPRFADAEARRRHREELDAALSQYTSRFDPRELAHALQAAGVAAFPALRAPEIFADPHLASRGFVVEVEHPKLGRQKVFAPPWKFSAAPPQISAPAPLMGQHNEYVLKDLLGLSRAEIEELEREGVLCR